MARKGKQEVKLQLEVNTQEEWEDMLTKDGLMVVDVYQEWCGPCKAVLGYFKRLKNELGDDLLNFAVAKADTVDALSKYRGKCEPCFLFFAGAVLVAVSRGANAQALVNAVTEQLTREHKVLNGEAEREAIKDPGIPEDVADDEDVEVLELKKGVTLAILKPDLVASGHSEEVIQELEENGFEILERLERPLSEDEARCVYNSKNQEEYFEELIKFVTSGSSILLVLAKDAPDDDVIDDLRELLGPFDFAEAKQDKSDSIRARFGTEQFRNAIHGSGSKKEAESEIQLFFPDFVAPTYQSELRLVGPRISTTLALIRPDAYEHRKEEILAKIEEAGFTIAMQKEVELSKEMAEEFYTDPIDENYREQLVAVMSSGPSLALGLTREDAIRGWNNLLGPKDVDEAKDLAPESLRAIFASDKVQINQLHGSDTAEAAEREVKFFFPVETTMAVVKPDGYEHKDEIMQAIEESGFRIVAKKELTLAREMAQQFYADQADKAHFGELTEHMSSGITIFLLLTREDAVKGWRSMMGTTDPEAAKEQNPQSMRARFGTSILQNAVHGSSNLEQALHRSRLIFGDVTFESNGEVAGLDEEDQYKSPQKEAAAKTEELPATEKTDEATEEKPRSPVEPVAEKPEETAEDKAAESPADDGKTTEPEQVASGEDAGTSEQHPEGDKSEEPATEVEKQETTEQTSQEDDAAQEKSPEDANKDTAEQPSQDAKDEPADTQPPESGAIDQTAEDEVKAAEEDEPRKGEDEKKPREETGQTNEDQEAVEGAAADAEAQPSGGNDTGEEQRTEDKEPTDDVEEIPLK